MIRLQLLLLVSITTRKSFIFLVQLWFFLFLFPGRKMQKKVVFGHFLQTWHPELRICPCLDFPGGAEALLAFLCAHCSPAAEQLLDPIGRAPGSFSRLCLCGSGHELSRDTINPSRGPGTVTEGCPRQAPPFSWLVHGVRASSEGNAGGVRVEEGCPRRSVTVLGQCQYYAGTVYDFAGKVWYSAGTVRDCARAVLWQLGRFRGCPETVLE